MKTESFGQNMPLKKRIDFHTHILPEMDDGSTSVEMSMQMIQTLHEQGVFCIVLTPHFYPSRDNPKHFLEKRSDRMELLKSQFHEESPLLLLGAEIQYFEGITAMRELPEMRIERSRGLMIEMPMCRWSGRMIGDLKELNHRREYQVILAHAERYLPFGNLPAIRDLAECGVIMQVSAGAFSGVFKSWKILNMLDKGLVHILGSDCHNLASRPPNLENAYVFIERKRGEGAVQAIINHGMQLLFGQQIVRKNAADEILRLQGILGTR